MTGNIIQGEWRGGEGAKMCIRNRWRTEFIDNLISAGAPSFQCAGLIICYVRLINESTRPREGDAGRGGDF